MTARWRMAAALAAAAMLAAAPAAATACRLALVLAVDASNSVDAAEFRQQFDGLAGAFRDAEVREAILGGGAPVAMAAFEWSSPERRMVTADWTVMAGEAELDRFADMLAAHERTTPGRFTAIGAALVYAEALFARGPDCARRVIDVSGDGFNNEGPTPRDVYVAGRLAGVTVNALVVGGLAKPKLAEYFEREVIRGRDAFAMATEGFADYPEAIRRKLLREIRPEQIARADYGPEDG